MNISQSHPSPTSVRSVPVYVEHAVLQSWLKPTYDKGTSGTSGDFVNPDTGLEYSTSRSDGGLQDNLGRSSKLHVSQDVQTYFSSIESRQCRTSSVGPAHTLKIEQRLPIVRSDGQDSGVEDLGMASPGIQAGLYGGTKTTLGQKDFMVYKRALLCAQFPVLSTPQNATSPHPAPSSHPYPLSQPHTHPSGSPYTYLQFLSPHRHANLEPAKVSLAGDYGIDGRSDDESEEEVLVQNEMLVGVVRQAFQLTEERHRYYDEVITEGLSRKAPARILIEELVSRLSVVENNRHPFYYPQAFEPRAYDIWQQSERHHIGELIESFWQFSLPSPANSMVKPSYWQTVHEEYQDLMVRLIRLDRQRSMDSYTTSSMLTSTSRRLLKEFGLRYGVGELYRRIVFLEYVASKDHFECEVWYMEMILKELSKLKAQLPGALYQARFVMVRQEFELLQDVLSKLHEHSKHGLQGLMMMQEDDAQRAVTMVNLLSAVLNLKSQLTGHKGSSLEHYLEGYIKESAKQAYHRHKHRLETELGINTYLSPVTAELVIKLIGLVEQDVCRCQEHYQDEFSRYKQNITELTASTFYLILMADVNLVCEIGEVDLQKELHCIDQDLLALAQRLSQLDAAWRDYVPRQAQQWRQPMLTQAKSWLKTMTKQLSHLVVHIVNTDQFKSDFAEDTSSHGETDPTEPKHRQSSILRRSPYSAFTAVSSAEGSLDRVRGQKVTTGQAHFRARNRKGAKQEKAPPSEQERPVLYFSSNKMTRTKSMPDLTHPVLQQDIKDDKRKNASTVEIYTEQDDVSLSRVQIHDEASGLVSFAALDRKTRTMSDERELDMEKENVSSHEELGGNTHHSTEQIYSDNPDLTQITDEKLTTDALNNNSIDTTRVAESVILPVEDTTVDVPNRDSDLETSQSHAVTQCTPVNDISNEAGPSTLVTHDLQGVIALEQSVTIASSSHHSSKDHILSQTSSDHSPSPRSISTAKESRTTLVSFKSQADFVSRSTSGSSKQPDKFSSSLVDVMFMTQRVISFMQKLIRILCPVDVELPPGPDGDFGGALGIRTFWEQVRIMKMELKDITEQAIVELLCLYANNLLAMDLCATEKDKVNKLVNEEVLFSVFHNRQESMLSNCRHERESNTPCNYYIDRDAALLCDKHEPITRQMCVRINNTWSIICLLPKLASMLQSRLRGRPSSPDSPSEDDQLQNRIFEAQLHADMEDSILVQGEHSGYLRSVLDAQIQLLAYKLNLVLHQALHVLLCPDFDDLTITDRLQPLTSCLHDHWQALDRWLTPACLALFMQKLWLYLVGDFEMEVEGLRLMRDLADSQALVLSQSISHLIEFLHARGQGLAIDQLVKPAEVVLNKLQLYSLPSKILIQLYQKQMNKEQQSDTDSNPLPHAVMQTMYQALHKQRKCFTGHHLTMWLLVHYYKAQDHAASKRAKYKLKAQEVGQKLLDMGFIQHVSSQSRHVIDVSHDDLSGFSSDTSVTDATPYPAVTIHSVPKTSISRRSQEIGTESSEDSLENAAIEQQRHRRTKRRISDFYSEEAETSDESSTSKSEEAVRRTVILKADIHVPPAADPDDTTRRSSLLHSDEQLKDTPSASTAQTADDAVHSQPKTLPQRKSQESPEIQTASSSSSSRPELPPQPPVHRKSPESKHIFFSDMQHFYFFSDVDDQLFYSMSSSGDFTRSISSREGHPHRMQSSETHPPHLKQSVVSAEFVLVILHGRRKRSQIAKDFTRSVPTEFWREENESSCCNCFN